MSIEFRLAYVRYLLISTVDRCYYYSNVLYKVLPVVATRANECIRLMYIVYRILDIMCIYKTSRQTHTHTHTPTHGTPGLMFWVQAYSLCTVVGSLRWTLIAHRLSLSYIGDVQGINAPRSLCIIIYSIWCIRGTADIYAIHHGGQIGHQARGKAVAHFHSHGI